MQQSNVMGRFFAGLSILLWWGGLAVAHAEEEWPACNPAAKTQRLSIVHLSDLHASYNPDGSGSSAYARARGYYLRTRSENPFTLFTNAGDDYEKGSIAEALSRGRSTREVVQAMGFHVRTLGNHDFAWGLEELLAFSHDPTALVVSSNIRLTSSNESGAAGWVAYGERSIGCLRVGFFGLLSRPWSEQGQQLDGSYYPQLQADYRFTERAREMVARYRAQVDLLVLVSHLGIYDDRRLAEAVPGIDVILGGHSHTLLSSPERVGDTSIVHVGDHAEYLGRLDLEIDLATRKPVGKHFRLVPNGAQSGLAADPLIQHKVAEVLQPFSQPLLRPFAWVHAPLGREAVASLTARAAVESLGVDAVLIDPATVWGGWSPGNLTQQAVLDALKVEREPVGEPGVSSLYRIELSGRELVRVREAFMGFLFHGPPGIDPERRYSLALQKPQAFHLPAGLSGQTPQPLAELWEAVVAYGQTRSAARLALDSDQPVTGFETLVALRNRPLQSN